MPRVNEALPRRNETFPVGNRTLPTENEAFLTENETFPVGNDAFGLKKGRSIEKKAHRRKGTEERCECESAEVWNLRFDSTTVS